jgi:transglutaminase/protease-like cytokinesis protein 3
MLNYSTDGSVDLKIKYFQAPPETKAVEEFAIKFVSTSIKSSMTDLEKLIVVHDFIIKSVKYDYSLKNRSPYLAIKEKKSVCSGFALLAGKLLEIAKVKQFYVTGDSTDPTTHKNGKHIWNKITLQGMWYNIDFTWDSCCKESNPYIYFCVISLILMLTMILSYIFCLSNFGLKIEEGISLLNILKIDRKCPKLGLCLENL